MNKHTRLHSMINAQKGNQTPLRYFLHLVASTKSTQTLPNYWALADLLDGLGGQNQCRSIRLG